MKVYTVIKTDGIYCDDTTIIGVYAEKEKAEQLAEAERREMKRQAHESAYGHTDCEPDQHNECAACEAFETESHYVDVEGYEVWP